MRGVKARTRRVPRDRTERDARTRAGCSTASRTESLPALAGLTSRSPRAPVAALVLALTLAAGASPAAAESVGQKIVEKCGHHESLSGYTQQQYEEALKDMSTGTSEYSSCEEEIRKAELAAVGGGAVGGRAAAASSAPIPLTPAEQTAVRHARKHGSAPVRVGNEPIRPGVVHANIASAINTLPHSLFAVIALMLAAAAALAVGEVRKRVRARRHG